jgi:hypothetical protein
MHAAASNKLWCKYIHEAHLPARIAKVTRGQTLVKPDETWSNSHLDGLWQLLGDALGHLTQLTQGPVGLQAGQSR